MVETVRSELNRDVPVAKEGEFAPLHIGKLDVWPPVILAPMAGITNYPFRRLCREYGAGLYVSEMITARGLVREHPKTLHLATFGPGEDLRSIQLYGYQPDALAEATRRLVSEGLVDHVDLNFGCPVRKVTSRGGGAALPLKPNLLRRLVRAVVQAAGDVPVTIKFRKGVNDDLLTYRSTGKIGEEEGCAAVGLHARTAAQLYSGEADWSAIADLKSRITTIPVLGNGDIWEAWDALRMMRETGCDGVIVGRGCLGRPWLFRDLTDVFEGREPSPPPNFGGVREIMLRHAGLLAEWFGETRGLLMMRRQTAWYTKSFPGGARLRQSLMKVTTLEDLEQALEGLDAGLPFPLEGLRAKRGKSGGSQRVSLPEGYLDHLDDDAPPDDGAEMSVGGG